MKTFGSQWERVQLPVTTDNIRVGLTLVSMVVIAVAGQRFS